MESPRSSLFSVDLKDFTPALDSSITRPTSPGQPATAPDPPVVPRLDNRTDIETWNDIANHLVWLPDHLRSCPAVAKIVQNAAYALAERNNLKIHADARLEHAKNNMRILRRVSQAADRDMFECQTKVRKILATLAHAPKDQVHVIAETYEGVTYDVDDASQCGGGEMNDVWDFTSESSDYEAYGTYGY